MADREEEHRRCGDGELPAIQSERDDPVATQSEEERRHAERRQMNQHDAHRREEREVPGSIERRRRERGGLLAGQRREEGGHGSMLRADHEHVCEHRARERERQDEPEDDLHLSDAEVEAEKEERAAHHDGQDRRMLWTRIIRRRKPGASLRLSPWVASGADRLAATSLTATPAGSVARAIVSTMGVRHQLRDAAIAGTSEPPRDSTTPRRSFT